MLRVHLPPNFAAAAARDAIPLRVDVDLSAEPPLELFPALALLQRWSGAPTPPKFIQLTRAQVRDLAAAVGEQPLFVENGKPTAWHHDELVAEPAQDETLTRSVTNADIAGTPRRPASRPQLPPMTIDGSEHFLAVTLPSREHPRYDEALALLKENGFMLEPSNRKWWLRDRHKTLNFLAAHLTRLRDIFGAELTANFEKNAARFREAEVATEVVEDHGEYAVTIALQAGSADESTLRAAVAGNRGYLEADGKIFLLNQTKLEKVARAQRAIAGDPNAAAAPRQTRRIPAARIAETQDILEELSPNFQAPEAWRQRSTALRTLSTLTPAPLPPPLERQLRPYQRLGAAWLYFLYQQGLGGILADEMGLGKTLQALGLLTAISCSPARESRDMGSRVNSPPPVPPLPRRATNLVVCPASLLENWRREAARFAPDLRTFVHHGDNRLATAVEFGAYDLIITSYGTLTRDQALFSSVTFSALFADEAQHIKNRRSQNAAALRALQAKARFLLTGTPLENSLEDLRSLFEVLLPGYLPRVPGGLRGDERAWYDERLKAQTAPYILRRTKQAVAPELPARLEQVIWCELTPTQAALYRETQERSERELFDLEAAGASEQKLKFAALTQLLRLRQICCDPRLVGSADQPPATPTNGVPGSPVRENRDDFASHAANRPGSPEPGYAKPFAASAKLDAFNELLAEAVDDGHRVLVFSQFTSLLGLLRSDLDDQQLAYCYLDGSMPTRARQAEVDRFQSSADIPLFLLSLKAGGTGLNLTGADTVVHYDPWWNPAAEAQATDRAHRIGQSRVVTSYKLIASGTVEEKVLALQAEKRALLASVFEASDATTAKLSLADLKSLLQ